MEGFLPYITPDCLVDDIPVEPEIAERKCATARHPGAVDGEH